MGAVRILVGSLMGGAFCPFREVASGDIAMLGDEPARAEDCPVSPTSARVARFAGVRSADVVALILGSQYGRTREEQNREPQRAATGFPGRDRIEAALFPPARERAALSNGARCLAVHAAPADDTQRCRAVGCFCRCVAHARTVRQSEVP